MLMHTVRFIICGCFSFLFYELCCASQCVCVRWPAAFFIMQKLHTIFFGELFHRFLFACLGFFYYIFRNAFNANCTFWFVHLLCQNATGFGVDFRSVSPFPFPLSLFTTFSGVFVAFAYVVLILIACRHRHCSVVGFHFFPFHISLQSSFLFSFFTISGRVHVVADFIFCKYSNYICSLMATLCFEARLLLLFVFFFFFGFLDSPGFCTAFFRDTCAEWLSVCGCGHRFFERKGLGTARSSKDNYARTHFGVFFSFAGRCNLKWVPFRSLKVFFLLKFFRSGDYR